MGPIVVATGNPHKVEELRAILGPLGVELLSLADAGDTGPEPDEPGSTFEENAALKALAYAERTGLPCLADDSGLEVDALAGAPGVISARYHSDGRETDLPRAERDRLNNERLLNELESVPPDRRTARFVCAMALAHPARKVLASVRGAFEGRIGLPGQVPRGSNGFGYDPLFLVAPDFTRTSAELAPDEKNRVSHRGNAARAMAVSIEELLRSGA